ncbi:class I SAM-dependent methyltransferase [Planctomycetota bacterium]
MNLLEMKGSWGPLTSWIHQQVVARGMEPLYGRFADEVVPEGRGAQQVIDLGCGDGRLARILAERHPDWTVRGLDLSPHMVGRARSLHGGVGNVRFEIGDAMALSLDDGSLDLVVSVASVKHWPDRARGIGEVMRVLRPGGTFCILEADSDCSPEAARRFVGYWRYVLPGTSRVLAAYFRGFVAGQALNHEELTTLLDDAGFAAATFHRDDELPFVTARVVKAAT